METDRNSAAAMPVPRRDYPGSPVVSSALLDGQQQASHAARAAAETRRQKMVSATTPTATPSQGQRTAAATPARTFVPKGSSWEAEPPPLPARDYNRVGSARGAQETTTWSSGSDSEEPSSSDAGGTGGGTNIGEIELTFS